MSIVPPKTELESASRRRSAWDWGHLVVFLAAWGPLNPFVLNMVRWTLVDPAGPGWDGALYREFAGWVGATVLGPFAAVTEGRNAAHCLKFAWQGLPFCVTPVLVAMAMQICWRPQAWAWQVIRQSVWGMAWLVWFGGAFLSIVNNSG